MKIRFSNLEVEKIAKLSALELTEEEKNNFTQQFSNILDYFELLKNSDIPEVVNDNSDLNLVEGREDQVEKSNVVPEKFSPYMDGRFFKVPKIIDNGK